MWEGSPRISPGKFIVWWFWVRIWGCVGESVCTRGGRLSPNYPAYWWHHLWYFLRHSWFGTFCLTGAIYSEFLFGKYYHPATPWTSRFSTLTCFSRPTPATLFSLSCLCVCWALGLECLHLHFICLPLFATLTPLRRLLQQVFLISLHPRLGWDPLFYASIVPSAYFFHWTSILGLLPTPSWTP